jgi:hypothetical protein
MPVAQLLDRRRTRFDEAEEVPGPVAKVIMAFSSTTSAHGRQAEPFSTSLSPGEIARDNGQII